MPGRNSRKSREMAYQSAYLVERYHRRSLTSRPRSIGVSNFEVEHLEEVVKTAKVVPAVNQVSVSLDRSRGIRPDDGDVD